METALAYLWLQLVIAANGAQSETSLRYYRATGRKALFATATYLVAAIIAWWVPPLAVTIPALIALMWIRPWGAFDRWFLRCD